MEAIDRQEMIWSVLDQSLTREEKQQIQVIVAATPAEHLAHTVLG
jgi:hypothetical protein